MQQPPGGPGSAAQSAALAPLDSRKGRLTLQSKPPQPLGSSSELMSCCARFPIFLCLLLGRFVSAYWMRRRLGLGFRRGIEVWCAATAWHCSQGQTPTAPLPRRPPPVGLIPVSTGLTNFTASPPAVLSRHWLNPRSSTAATISPLHMPPPSMPCGVVSSLFCLQYVWDHLHAPC